MQQAGNEQLDFNVNLGKKLSFLRQNRRLSQGELGDLLGVRAQQIHKYETGENKLSAERLKDCADVLGVSINYFFICKVNFYHYLLKRLINWLKNFSLQQVQQSLL